LAGKGRFLSDNKDKSQVMRFLGVNFDITNRKLAEKQIKASLAEKEVLLKEIHHRVKNNLQIISSLVSLQADTLTDERIREELNDVRDRVRSMALVHEKLYQTNDMASLDFAEYATSLMHTLWRSHSTLAVNVQIELAVEPVSLSIEAAVLCGLILNELASNALKHAFPNNSSGEVELGLKLDPATETVYLRIRDNGIGLPADFDWRQSESLGLRLVKILAGQLRGIVETETGPGTEFKIIFPLKGSKQ
jgi:two-component sensor histidine kinase